MIRAMIIGQAIAIGQYAQMIEESEYYSGVSCFDIDIETDEPILFFKKHGANVVMFVDACNDFPTMVEPFVRSMVPIFFVNQFALNLEQISRLEKLTEESDLLVFPAFKMDLHPIFDGFTDIVKGRLQLNYNVVVASKKEYISELFEVLYLMSGFSPMPVKKMDVSTSMANCVRIHVSMFDHSTGQIELRIGKESYRVFTLESSSGNYKFDLTAGELENRHGTFFPSLAWDDAVLSRLCINKFAENVITAKKSTIGFFRYLLVCRVMSKINPFFDL